MILADHLQDVVTELVGSSSSEGRTDANANVSGRFTGNRESAPDISHSAPTTTANIASLYIEVWDKDKVGKDDFMYVHATRLTAHVAALNARHTARTVC